MQPVIENEVWHHHEKIESVTRQLDIGLVAVLIFNFDTGKTVTTYVNESYILCV